MLVFFLYVAAVSGGEAETPGFVFPGRRLSDRQTVGLSLSVHNTQTYRNQSAPR